MYTRILTFSTLLSLSAATHSVAQIRVGMDLNYGINVKRVEKSGGSGNVHRDEKFTSLGNYGLNLFLSRNKKARLNYGFGLGYNTYHCNSHVVEISELGYNSIDDRTYRFSYVNLYPMFDFAFDRKGFVHCQVSAPVSIKVRGSMEAHFVGYGKSSSDTSFSTTENFRNVVPQLSVRFIGYVPLRNKLSLSVNAAYTGALVGFSGDFKPAQMSFGLGLGYKYAKRLEAKKKG